MNLNLAMFNVSILYSPIVSNNINSEKMEYFSAFN